MSVRAKQQTESAALIERLLALETSASRCEFVASHAATDWDDIVQALTERVWQEVRVDAHRADRIAEIGRAHV